MVLLCVSSYLLTADCTYKKKLPQKMSSTVLNQILDYPFETD